MARNTEKYRSDTPKKSASDISCHISRCHVSKSASRGVPKIRVLGGENPRKIRVDQESAGLKDLGGGGGGWDESLCLERRLGEMLALASDGQVLPDH